MEKSICTILFHYGSIGLNSGSAKQILVEAFNDWFNKSFALGYGMLIGIFKLDFIANQYFRQRV
jgi:hypothetical protein